MLRSLIAVRFGSLFSGGVGKDGKQKRFGRVGMIVLIAFLVLLFGVFFLSIASSLAIVLVPRGFDAPYFAIFNILTFLMVFVLSVFETKSELFECKDNELLLSMPIPPRDIVLSRSLAVIILNIGEAMIVSVPAVIMFVVCGGSAWYIPTALLASVFIALLATSLSCAVGYLVALLSARFRNNTVISVVLTLAFLALYFVGYTAFLNSITSLEEDASNAADVIGSAFSSIAFLGNISLAKPLEMSIFIVISVLITLLAWYIIAKNYIKVITTRVDSAKKVYVRERLNASSAFASLAKKEIAAFFSSSAYILNGVLGSIFQIVLAVMLLFSADSTAEMASELALVAGEDVMPLLITVVMVGCTSVSSVSASALSVEGKSYWILKTSPIPTITVIYAKLVPHLVVILPTSVVSSVIAAIAIGAAPLWWPFMILIPILGAAVFAMLGLILNIAMPKFDFVNVVQVVKQSAPVFIVTLGGLLLIIILAIGALILSLALGATLAALIMAALFVALFLATYLILTGPSARRLERL